MANHKVLDIDVEDCCVIGTGYSVNTYFQDGRHVEGLRKKKIFGFQRAFPYIKQEFDCMPDFWFWTDPNAALEGLQYLVGCDSPLEKPLHILLAPYLDTPQIEDASMNTGTSPTWRSNEKITLYYSLLEEVKERNDVKFLPVPIWTTKYLSHLDAYRENQGYLGHLWAWRYSEAYHRKMRNDLDYYVREISRVAPPSQARGPYGDYYLYSLPSIPLRFQMPFVLMGTFPYESDNSFRHVGSRENKLTYCIFPLLEKLGCKKLGVLGFDFGGGRCFDDTEITHPFDTAGVDMENPIHGVVRLWNNEWSAHHGMEIHSLVDPGESKLNTLLEKKP